MRVLIILFVLLVSTYGVQAQIEETAEFLLELDSLFPTDTLSVTYYEINPEFLGGNVVFYKYVQDNLNYPLDAKKQQVLRKGDTIF